MGHEGHALRFEPAGFDEPMPPSMLNIEVKTRSNFFPWRGQFSPELVEAFLRSYSREGDVVLDPFAGSGTVLVEAGRLGHTAFAGEINPAAAIIATLYEFINVPLHKRKTIMSSVAETLRRCIVGSAVSANDNESVLEVASLLAAAELPHHDKSGQLLRALVILLDLSAGVAADGHASWQKWLSLEKRIISLPHSDKPVRVILGDARALTLNSGTVDFVVTSPPYINVFNYHHNFRGSVEALAWAPLHVAKSEIGSNRKFRGNRFLTVVQYQLDMVLALLELRRVCSSTARVLFILGRESSVQKTAFYNGTIVEALAPIAGFSSLLRQERVFTNRFGARIFEDILHLVPNGDRQPSIENVTARARAHAHAVLVDALDRVPRETEQALKKAIEVAHTVQPSPIFKAKDAKTGRRDGNGASNSAS
jgi:hypothetical protein